MTISWLACVALLCKSTNISFEPLLMYLLNANVVHGLGVLEVKCPVDDHAHYYQCQLQSVYVKFNLLLQMYHCTQLYDCLRPIARCEVDRGTHIIRELLWE